MNKLLKQAFTLIELLVVIAIIGILSGLIIVGMNGMTNSANIAKSQVFSNSLRNSLIMNLISEWKFDGITSDGSAAVAGDVLDTWKNTNNGVIGSAPTVKTGTNCVRGSCLSFDGGSNYIDIGNGVSLQNQDLTIEFWANAPSIELSLSGIIGTTGYGSNLGFGLYANDNNTYFVWAGNGSTRQYVTNIFIITTGWNHYVVTKSGATLNAYKNGVITKTGTNLTNSIIYTGTSWHIGESISSSYNFYGLMDEVRMYGAAISASQIKEQYYIGLNNLLANRKINTEDYGQRINLIAEK